MFVRFSICVILKIAIGLCLGETFSFTQQRNISPQLKTSKQASSIGGLKNFYILNAKIMKQFNSEVIKRPLSPSKRVLNVEIFCNSRQFQLVVDAYPTYVTKEPLHGCHLFVLHPHTSKIMLHRHYLPDLPLQGESLAATLARIQPGRVVLLVAAPGNTSYIIGAEKHLSDLGSHFINRQARGETLLLLINSNYVQEVLLRKRFYKEDLFSDSTYTLTQLTAIVPAHITPRCPWYNKESLQDIVQFCETFEGMMETCQCNESPFRKTGKESPVIPRDQEENQIPLVILSINGVTSLHKLIYKIRQLNGFHRVKLLVLIGTDDTRSIKVLNVLQVEYIISKEFSVNMSIHEENRMVRFIELTSKIIMDHFPNNERFIFLSDGTIISRDTFSFFNDGSWLLDKDPTIDCIAAFNPNYVRQLAHDSAVLYRATMFPKLAFMVRRSWLLQKFEITEMNNITNLTIIPKPSHCVFPQVSRAAPDMEASFHRPQLESLYVIQNGNTIHVDPVVQLKTADITYREYWQRIKNNIVNGKIITNATCEVIRDPPLPVIPRVIFVQSQELREPTEYSPVSYVLECYHLRGFDTSVQFEGVLLVNYNIYVVMCPASPFCPSLSATGPSSSLYWNSLSVHQRHSLDMAWELHARYHGVQRVRQANAIFDKVIDLSDFVYLMQ